MKAVPVALTLGCLALLAGCPMATEPAGSSSPAPASSTGKPVGLPETSTGAPAGGGSAQAAPANSDAATIPLNAENTSIEFVGSKANGSHTGGFKKLAGSLALTADKTSLASVSVTIEVGSMYTDNPMLTRHLLNADFFEASAYPEVVFATTSIEPKAEAENTHVVTGDLTMHGVTKQISFPARITVTGGKVALNSKFTIDRREFNITYGQGMVNNEVAITVKLEAGS